MQVDMSCMDVVGKWMEVDIGDDIVNWSTGGLLVRNDIGWSLMGEFASLLFLPSER